MTRICLSVFIPIKGIKQIDSTSGKVICVYLWVASIIAYLFIIIGNCSLYFMSSVTIAFARLNLDSISSLKLGTHGSCFLRISHFGRFVLLVNTWFWYFTILCLMACVFVWITGDAIILFVLFIVINCRAFCFLLWS